MDMDMDFGEDTSQTANVNNRSKQLKTHALCKVCGTQGAQIHYGGLCCVSCKMFFRRNAQYSLSMNQCVFNETCDITINSRRACRYCRLQKCFVVGMQRELLRASHHRQEKSNMKSIVVLNKKSEIDLFHNNHLILTDEQWTRLSNIINIYNAKSQVSDIRCLLSAQAKQPMKMRLKMCKTDILQIILSMYQSIRPFMEAIPEFQNMTLHDQHELIQRNLSYAGGFNGIIIFRDADVINTTAFKNGFPSIYGSNIVDDAVVVARRTDNDKTLLKLLIPILLFSTTLYIMNPSDSYIHYRFIENSVNSLFFNTKHLLNIQNTYIEIMFKYMIYRYGYTEASLRFASLIKSFLDQSMCVLRATEILAHNQLMRTVFDETHAMLASQNQMVDQSNH